MRASILDDTVIAPDSADNQRFDSWDSVRASMRVDSPTETSPPRQADRVSQTDGVSQADSVPRAGRDTELDRLVEARRENAADSPGVFPGVPAERTDESVPPIRHPSGDRDSTESTFRFDGPHTDPPKPRSYLGAIDVGEKKRRKTRTESIL